MKATLGHAVNVCPRHIVVMSKLITVWLRDQARPRRSCRNALPTLTEFRYVVHRQMQWCLPIDHIPIHAVLRAWAMRVRYMQLYRL